MIKVSCPELTSVLLTSYLQSLSISIAFVSAVKNVDFKDLMEIGDGATVTITNANKQGGLVAIYYLGTLVGALMYGLVTCCCPTMF
jgi:hypothetical protein